MGIKLDDIRKSIEEKYAAFEIEVGDKVVRLVNPMRLSEGARAELTKTYEILSGDSEDVNGIDVVRNGLATVAESKGGAKILLDAVGRDWALLLELLKAYTEGTSAGEASPSED